MSVQDERRAYARGYNAGAKGAWPVHRPPSPPLLVVARALTAAQNLRDHVDGEIATLLEDDELVKSLGPLIDEFDNAMAKITAWIRITAHKGEDSDDDK